MKSLLDSDLAIYVVAIGACVVGVIAVVIPVAFVDAWGASRAGLAAGTCFFALAALVTNLYKREYSPDSLLFIFAPALLAEVFLGVLIASSIALTITAFVHFFPEELGPIFVIMLVAMLPVGMLRESLQED